MALYAVMPCGRHGSKPSPPQHGKDHDGQGHHEETETDHELHTRPAAPPGSVGAERLYVLLSLGGRTSPLRGRLRQLVEPIGDAGAVLDPSLAVTARLHVQVPTLGRGRGRDLQLGRVLRALEPA